jgi:tetratricopeptide (TPR) repeat protein
MTMSRRHDFSTARLSAAFLVCLLLTSGLRAGQSTRDHAVPENLEVVSFGTSCKPRVQKEFERSVALLHSFAYSAAEASFRQVLEKDPNCAIAHWGVAMTYFHQLWDPPIRQDIIPQGREELRRAQEIGGGTDRERGFIRALALFYDRDFGAVPYRERVSQYEGAMEELAAAYPNDAESQVFYALALLANASPFDKTHSRQKHAVKILDPLFHEYAQHPGIAHYLIHACDNQEMAQQGLFAASAYSKIAPSAPHALHMPSHIFTRLGMWSNSITSNLAARGAAHNQRDIGEELHAMDYLVYAYLQEGREKEANEVIQQLKAMSSLDEGDFKIAYAGTAMPVRYALERRQWAEAASIVAATGAPLHVTAVAVWARAIGLARSGHAAGARQEVEKLRQLERQLRASGDDYAEYWAKQVEIQKVEAMAWSAQAEGEADEARNLLRNAADNEDAFEKLPVTPGPVIPAREQLGDLLLQQGQPKQALKEFQISLSNSPRRRGATIGVARASQGLGMSASHN